MRNAWLELKLRLRRWRGRLANGVALVVRDLANEIGAAELACLIGLLFIWIGLAQVSHAAADVVVGAVIVWMALPSRPPLIRRPPETGTGGTKSV